MIRQKPKRVIQIERLEDRNLLSATADIVLIVDDSQTMTEPQPGERPVLDFVTQAKARLLPIDSRG